MTEPSPDASTPAQVEQLQDVRPVWQLKGHEVCADVHIALSVAQAVLSSRRERVGELPESGTADTLLRELRAMGVQEVSPHTIAMVALVESAVSRLAEVGGMSESAAWEQLHKDVVIRHCASPDRQ